MIMIHELDEEELTQALWRLHRRRSERVREYKDKAITVDKAKALGLVSITHPFVMGRVECASMLIDIYEHWLKTALKRLPHLVQVAGGCELWARQAEPLPQPISFAGGICEITEDADALITGCAYGLSS